MNAQQPRPCIFLVEDNPDDALFFRAALEHAGASAELVVAVDAEEAHARLADLARAGRRPQLIVLDLNLPGANGHELLDALRRTEQACNVPIVVLTTSAQPADVRRAYAEGANAYVIKPRDYETLKGVVAAMERFWLQVATLCDAP